MLDQETKCRATSFACTDYMNWSEVTMKDLSTGRHERRRAARDISRPQFDGLVHKSSRSAARCHRALWHKGIDGYGHRCGRATCCDSLDLAATGHVHLDL
jgi:hypothetical protein